MQRETTGHWHDIAASGGIGRKDECCNTAEVEKQPMTVGDTMMQHRPQADEHTSLHLDETKQGCGVI